MKFESVAISLWVVLTPITQLHIFQELQPRVRNVVSPGAEGEEEAGHDVQVDQ